MTSRGRWKDTGTFVVKDEDTGILHFKGCPCEGDVSRRRYCPTMNVGVGMTTRAEAEDLCDRLTRTNGAACHVEELQIR
jgi:hypothetical protein